MAGSKPDSRAATAVRYPASTPTASVAWAIARKTSAWGPLSSELAGAAVYAGAIEYAMERDEGLRRDVVFCYDLALPADFVPNPADGEVEAFDLWPIARVVETVRGTDHFKFNVNLVMLDFAVRHGLLRPDDPEYLDVATGLHRPLD